MSQATVSRVLNASRQVDPALAERVNVAIRELSYRPSRVARNLRVQTSSIMAVVVADIGNPFFTRMVRAIQDETWASGRSVILCNTDEDVAKERAAIDVLVAERVGGVIIAPASERETDLGPLLRRGVPVVALDRRPPGDIDSVLADNRYGGAEAARHLIAAGCSSVGCITGPERVTTARERLEGFSVTLAAAGRPIDPAFVVHSDFREDGGRRAMLGWLDGEAQPDGVFVTNNLMTIGVLQALASRRWVVPRDIRVIGFDELPWVSGLAAGIPVVTQPTAEMARVAVEMLSSRLDGYDGPSRHVVLKPQVNHLDGHVA